MSWSEVNQVEVIITLVVEDRISVLFQKPFRDPKVDLERDHLDCDYPYNCFTKAAYSAYNRTHWIISAYGT